MEDHLKKLEETVAKIQQRNLRVEADKGWETSSTRIISIAVMTYIVVAVFLYMIGVSNFWISALVPAIGFTLSTQSLPFLKRWWIKAGRKK